MPRIPFPYLQEAQREASVQGQKAGKCSLYLPFYDHQYAGYESVSSSEVCFKLSIQMRGTIEKRS